ncbi:proline-rich proteoglycan 2-like [Phaenicophaeus curvirostris]|uniref:proline-rich proteoglycan 2-like n=1 Tax=Phaenicophaeus curvirostris TaxID=33595 RepID=UPI0037F0EAB2
MESESGRGTGHRPAFPAAPRPRGRSAQPRHPRSPKRPRQENIGRAFGRRRQTERRPVSSDVRPEPPLPGTARDRGARIALLPRTTGPAGRPPASPQHRAPEGPHGAEERKKPPPAGSGGRGCTYLGQRGARPLPPRPAPRAGQSRAALREHPRRAPTAGGPARHAHCAPPPAGSQARAAGNAGSCEPSRAEPSRAEPSRAEPSRAEPSRAEPSAATDPPQPPPPRDRARVTPDPPQPPPPHGRAQATPDYQSPLLPMAALKSHLTHLCHTYTSFKYLRGW